MNRQQLIGTRLLAMLGVLCGCVATPAYAQFGGEPDPAAALKGLCEAALQDEDGGALAARLDALTSAMAA